MHRPEFVLVSRACGGSGGAECLWMNLDERKASKDISNAARVNKATLKMLERVTCILAAVRALKVGELNQCDRGALITDDVVSRQRRPQVVDVLDGISLRRNHRFAMHPTVVKLDHCKGSDKGRCNDREPARQVINPCHINTPSAPRKICGQAHGFNDDQLASSLLCWPQQLWMGELFVLLVGGLTELTREGRRDR
jgi:hypothetical protein